MYLKHHEFEQRIDEAVDGAQDRGDALDPELKRELLFAASRGAEALEGLLACLDTRQRHAAFGFLQSEEGNAATAHSLGRMSDDEANYKARVAASSAPPVVEPKAAVQELSRRMHEEARAEAPQPAPAEEPAQAPVASDESEAAQDHRDNVLAREAHFAKKWEGDELLARALARHKARKGG